MESPQKAATAATRARCFPRVGIAHGMIHWRNHEDHQGASMKITAIEPQQRHPDRYNIALDGRFALGMDGALVVAEGLCVGLELSAADVERLAGREEERRLFDAAVRFLAPRPRSRAEVRRRLLAPRPNRPIPSREGVERILDRLEQMELLNDRDFA